MNLSRRNLRIKKQRLLLLPKLLTSRLRSLPNFIIIGAQKSGTSSLYDYMVRHPQIVRAHRKEVHFFDIHYRHGIKWYRANFPILNKQKGLITGESSPFYMFYPHTPRRIHQWVPEVKLIAILRNPVDRAYSQYHHEVRKGKESIETLPFEAAVDKEAERLEGELEKILKDEKYYSARYIRNSYLTRGKYIDQLETWAKYFPKEQMLILKSEELFKDPSSALQRVWQFLDLPAWELDQYEVRNPGSYSGTKMDAATRERLITYFEPYNKRLYEFLGTDLGWDR